MKQTVEIHPDTLSFDSERPTRLGLMFVASPHQSMEMTQVLNNDQQISVQTENYDQVVLVSGTHDKNTGPLAHFTVRVFQVRSVKA